LPGSLRPGLQTAFFAVPSGRDGRGREQQNERTNAMSEENSSESIGSKTPSHVAYQVRDREGRKGIWTRIGSAWAHGDGKGFNIQLESVPLDGRITLRVTSDKKD
jgi:hypothetical protein